jgi:hypothetical protein
MEALCRKAGAFVQVGGTERESSAKVAAIQWLSMFPHLLRCRKERGGSTHRMTAGTSRYPPSVTTKIATRFRPKRLRTICGTQIMAEPLPSRNEPRPGPRGTRLR